MSAPPDKATAAPPGQGRRSAAGWLARLAPLLIIGALLYAALFVQVAPVLPELQLPAVADRDRFFGIAAADGQLWAVGSKGKVVSSRDGGATWQLQPTPVSAHLQGVAAWDTQHLVAVGNGGTVIRSEDGGGRWQAVAEPLFDGRKFLRVRAFAGGEAWATGEFGMVLRSADRGVRWQAAMPAEDIGWNDVAVDGERVLVVGEFGRIARSEDGGASWQPVEAGIDASLSSVWLDGELAVAVGLDGRILRSDDGGRQWQAVDSGTREHLFSLARDAEGFVAVGDKGVVLAGSADARRWQAGRASDADYSWRTAVVRGEGGWIAAGQRLGPIGRPGG